MSKCFREIAPAGDRQATLHGVVFDVLVWSAPAPAWPHADLDALLIDQLRFQHQHRYQAIHANTGAYLGA